MRYPTSPAETIADGIIHSITISLACFGAYWMWHYEPMWQSPAMILAMGSYLVILLAAALVSGAYHMTPISPTRLRLRRADHALIFLRIASGYTPLTLILDTPFAYGLLALVWGVSLYGFLLKLLFWQGTGRSSVRLYAALSSALILLLWPMWKTMDHTVIWLLLTGGVFYATGGYIYAKDPLPFRYPLWHILATASSVFFYLSIVLAIG